jgi:hypothetical protein
VGLARMLSRALLLLSFHFQYLVFSSPLRKENKEPSFYIFSQCHPENALIHCPTDFMVFVLRRPSSIAVNKKRSIYFIYIPRSNTLYFNEKKPVTV